MPLHQYSAPFEIIDGDPARGLIVLCDHAVNSLPAGYGTLGLPKEEFSRHIAYDIGAAGVARGLARSLGVPAVLAGFSRLLIDPNRGMDDPTLIMQLSDRTVIPGNYPVSDAERGERIESFYRPYHDAVNATIDRSMAAGAPPALFSVHTFTGIWRGNGRPWHVAILWDSDDRLPRPLIDGLREYDDIVTGDNEPYDGALGNDTLFTHGTRRGLANALIEIRQDLLESEAGIEEWVGRLSPLLERTLAKPCLRKVVHGPSRTGPVDPIFWQTHPG